MKHFYAHIVDLDDVHSGLEILDITDDEKNHLIMVIESSLHHVIIDALLTDLSHEHKQSFLMHLTDDNHEKIWEVLNEGLEQPENKIKQAIRGLKEEFIKDLHALQGK